jgi:hypothetical protein
VQHALAAEHVIAMLVVVIASVACVGMIDMVVVVVVVVVVVIVVVANTFQHVPVRRAHVLPPQGWP